MRCCGVAEAGQESCFFFVFVSFVLYLFSMRVVQFESRKKSEAVCDEETRKRRSSMRGEALLRVLQEGVGGLAEIAALLLLLLLLPSWSCRAWLCGRIERVSVASCCCCSGRR